MAYTFAAEGWQDWDGNRHEGDPVEPEETQGIFVHAWDIENPEDQKWFWAFVGGAFEEWDEWWVYVGALMEMYGISVA